MPTLLARGNAILQTEPEFTQRANDSLMVTNVVAVLFFSQYQVRVRRTRVCPWIIRWSSSFHFARFTQSNTAPFLVLKGDICSQAVYMNVRHSSSVDGSNSTNDSSGELQSSRDHRSPEKTRNTYTGSTQGVDGHFFFSCWCPSNPGSRVEICHASGVLASISTDDYSNEPYGPNDHRSTRKNQW